MMCPYCTGCISRHGQHHPGIEARIRRAEEVAAGTRAPRLLTWRQKLQYVDPCFLIAVAFVIAPCLCIVVAAKLIRMFV